MASVVCGISIGQPGCLSGCAPSQLLHTCLLAEYKKLEKVLDFIGTTENSSVINILLILNPKRSILGGKLTLSQPKPGQGPVLEDVHHKRTVAHCGGLTWPEHQVPTKATLSFTSSTGQGRKAMTKGSSLKIRTGRDHSPITITGKTDSTWGN